MVATTCPHRFVDFLETSTFASTMDTIFCIFFDASFSSKSCIYGFTIKILHLSIIKLRRCLSGMARKHYIKGFLIVSSLAFAASEVFGADTREMQDQFVVLVSIGDYVP
ncbi:hypothetical protein Tco_0047055 [Tanacetum coccineum]